MMIMMMMIGYDIHDDGDDDHDNDTHDYDNHDYDNHDDDNHDDDIPASTDDTDLDLASDRETADVAWSGRCCSDDD